MATIDAQQRKRNAAQRSALRRYALMLKSLPPGQSLAIFLGADRFLSALSSDQVRIDMLHASGCRLLGMYRGEATTNDMLDDLRALLDSEAAP